MMKQQLATWLRRYALLRQALTLAIKLFAPRHHVGAMAVIFNQAGQILLVEHVFRPNYNWGLPGGWVERGENPADTVQRELAEELGLNVEIKRLLACEVQGHDPGGSTPLSLGLTYYGRLADNASGPAVHAYEILSIAWIDPAAIPYRLPTKIL
jgi:8-oxo-dGTP diphosphatase